VLATTELIFCAVVAVAALLATNPTHERFPTLSDCNTELPVAGVVAGRLYTVFPVAVLTKEVKLVLAEFQRFNLPPIFNV
jgi:hypothetical protein